jgi:hypothetical protein
MVKTKSITREEYPEWMEMLRRKYFGACLIEIARRGNGNQIHYVIGDEYYEKLLWDRDNQVNPEDEEFIGGPISKKL